MLNGLKIGESDSDDDNRIHINSVSNKKESRSRSSSSSSSSNKSSESSRSSSSDKKKKKHKNQKHKKKNSKKHKKEEKRDFAEILLREKMKEVKKTANKEHDSNINSSSNINQMPDFSVENEKNIEYLNRKRDPDEDNTVLLVDNKDEKILTNLSKFDILLNENKRIDEINKSKKANVRNKLDEILECFKKGDNSAFISKYSELEKLAKTKDNFYEKPIEIKNQRIDNRKSSDNYEDNEDRDSQSASDEEEKIDSGKFRKDNFEDETDAKFAYDKNRDFLNTGINLRLKSDLNLMNKFNNFEEGLNMSKSLIDYSNTIHKDHYDKDNKNALNVKQQKQIQDSLDKQIKKQERQKLSVLANCKKCYGAGLTLDSIISFSDKIYLSYPYSAGSITKYHMVLSTKEHINSFAAVEENIFNEIRNYMKSIVSFNIKNNMDTVFIEYSQQVSNHQHMEIECIPIKSKYLEDAKMYFKKAFSEQDYEWTSNKNLVDSTPYKGNLTKIINEKFSYVHVDFNAQGGFLHVIEDTSKFSQIFLKEIFCPLLKKETYEIKYPNKLSPKELIEVVEQYKNDFAYFDWTRY